MGWVIQMAGPPGSGKSTVAAAVGARHGIPVLDVDVIKTSLLDAGVPFAEVGPMAYRVLHDLALETAKQVGSVILDSPNNHPDVLHAGERISDAAGAHYVVVECWSDDLALLDHRIRARRGLRSQRRSVDEGPIDMADEPDPRRAFEEWMTRSMVPDTGHLRVESRQPLDEILSAVDHHLAGFRSVGPR